MLHSSLNLLARKWEKLEISWQALRINKPECFQFADKSAQILRALDHREKCYTDDNKKKMRRKELESETFGTRRSATLLANDRRSRADRGNIRKNGL